ncbi:MAG TPA: DUF58 domain-containing protein [Actinomycetota bacterium]|jgi:uncharacterized protein (DUF58 family)|nr:DUF58 domain-containing protein [Actinomycetota bacterium]
MPTVRGWLTAGTGVALWGTGRAFGAGPLEQVGFAFVVLVGIAVAVVAWRREAVGVDRALIPARARAGQEVTVELTVRNEGRRALPLLLIEDRLPLELAGQARFALSGVEPRGERTASYRLRPARRGRYELGPLRISYVDPFALAGTSVVIAGTTDLLVHPRIERLTLPRDLGTQRSAAMSALRQLSGARGEDFYTLREYAQGDDLRKIHWPSTAKRGKPMIRQEETPWHTRATILLDDRADGTSPGAFDRAVEAAASFADLYHRSGYTFRLTGAATPGIPSGRGNDHLQRCLDLLAELRPAAGGGVPDPLHVRLAELEAATGAEGTLVVVSTALSADSAAAVTRCLRRFRNAVVLLFPSHRFRGDRLPPAESHLRDAVARLGRGGIPSVVVGPGESLQKAWAALGGGMRSTAEEVTHGI